ncbi:MAG: galactosylceramidase [Verrucomicrobia bacterium]|nr:MAG: galactosylceramidase [Verrucomicrobiota bacterium]
MTTSPGFRISRDKLLAISGVLVLLGIVAGKVYHPSGSKDQKKVFIAVNANQEGRVFEGIGAVSAGASSRLLTDYPEPQRSEILDYLFKENFGAGFQHLKVEIGGDVNSADGCEPSHMHSREEENYSRGYEWWLMKEAKKRNPDLLLDCLAWGAPYWIGDFYSQDMADYVAKFIQGAKSAHGLDIDYTGIWNEVPPDLAWIKLLRRTLDARGLKQVKIVAADETLRRGWVIADEMIKDSELKDAIHAVGAHYPKFSSTAQAKQLGKPLWASEDGPWHAGWTSAMDLARMFNRNYVIGKITKTEIWSPVTSYYDNLPVPGSGVMRANSPWSGHYEVPPTVWATAHTTQFTRPGWQYLDGACVLIDGGSLVTLKSPSGEDYSMVIETTDTENAQTLSFQVEGAFAGKPLHVWRTRANEHFAELGVIQPRQGVFSLSLDARSIYSLTTTTGQRKGQAAAPPATPFPFPYREDFESYEAGAAPRYFADQAGLFEVVKRAGTTGNALRQVIPSKGIEWPAHFNPAPETFLGALNWTDYEVSVDALIEKAGFVSLFGRVGKIPQSFDPPNGYWLKVSDNGDWQLDRVRSIKGKMQDPKTIIGSGKVRFTADQWHRLGLRFNRAIIRVMIDHEAVAEIQDATFASGMVGIGGGWNGAQFDNLSISSGVDVEPRSWTRN